MTDKDPAIQVLADYLPAHFHFHELRDRIDAARAKAGWRPPIEPSAVSPHIGTPTHKALCFAARQFDFYADQHFAKTPPDPAKALVNLAWADYCLGVAHGIEMKAPLVADATQLVVPDVAPSPGDTAPDPIRATEGNGGDGLS